VSMQPPETLPLSQNAATSGMHCTTVIPREFGHGRYD
jgi:hypothetical protein